MVDEKKKNELQKFGKELSKASQKLNKAINNKKSQ